MSAARHAVFAEGVGKLLDRAEEIAGISAKDASRETILAKAAASKAIPDLRAALFPEDD